MFIIEYVYIPLSGKAYCTSDVCDSFDVNEISDREMILELNHSAWDNNRKRVRFPSSVTIPKQKISVRTLDNSEIPFGGVDAG